ncbi:MAG: T9SS type A sorting domain-containing protein [Bacteroidetes bacterium]|nr:T9SS type A sorting domain-containing protein [Bacteroidota bacterium]
MKNLLLFTLIFLVGNTFVYGQFNGEPDSTFATNGTLLFDQNGSDEIFSVGFVGPDNKIYMGGEKDGQNQDIMIVRYNLDGTLDQTFAGNGVFLFDPMLGADDYFADMAITSDGKIVFVGSTDIGNYNQVVGVLNPDGSFDESFYGLGYAVTGEEYNDYWRTCMVDGNDNILLGGSTGSAEGDNLTLLRLLPDYSQDPTFGFNGLVTLDFDDDEEFTYIMQYAVNRYYLIASIGTFQYVVGISGTGNLVNNFGSNGKKKLDFFPNDIELYSDLETTNDGSIFLSGLVSDPNFNIDVLVAKLTSDGSVDTDFAVDGAFAASLSTGYDAVAWELSILDDESLLMTGDVTLGDDRDMMSFRLAHDGFLYSNYGSNGLLNYNMPNGTDEFGGKHFMDNDGNVWLYGYSQQADSDDGLLIKLKTETPTAVKEAYTAENINLRLSPNPATSQLFASFDLTETTSAVIQIRNLNGQVLHHQNQGVLMAGKQDIDLSQGLGNLPAGMYLLSLETPNALYTAKLIKQ